MHFTTVIATATAALASTAMALPSPKRAEGSAVANLIAVNGFGDDKDEAPITVPFGTLTHYDYQVTGLQLKSVTVDVPWGVVPDVSDITCQMYRDQYGVQPGSAKFTSSQDASLSTNPVEFGWVLCYVNVDSA
ncbi:hypothetical protein G7Z17_g1254 [Cylindrodendrum hubeiense]|uniref:Uncharacterized protein n=1 Tax=Cylindrodendrum hubeiense TaxID=595255 RepID=A0A9P5LMC1_9HYPO|nr:hypothetical protein G7Z17_g1254 [Cylindrodendrum hubeiense]